MFRIYECADVRVPFSMLVIDDDDWGGRGLRVLAECQSLTAVAVEALRLITEEGLVASVRLNLPGVTGTANRLAEGGWSLYVEEDFRHFAADDLDGLMAKVAQII